MSFPTTNPDHLWNEWIRNNAPRGGPRTNRTPPTNTYPATQCQNHQMFQEPPLPPTTQQPRTTGGTYRIASVPLPPTFPSSPSRTHPPPRMGRLGTNPIHTPHPRLTNPIQRTLSRFGFTIPVPIPSPPAPFESSTAQHSPTSAHSPTPTATPPPLTTEETSLSPSEKKTTPSTPMVMTTSGPASTPLTAPTLDPTNPTPGKSGESTSKVEVDLRGLRTGSPWCTTSPSQGGPRYQYEEETLPSRPDSSTTEIEWNGPLQRETDYETYDPEQQTSRGHWSTPYSHSPWQRETAQTWTAPFDERFDTFHQDEETFGWTDDTDNYDMEYRGLTTTPSQDDRDYRGYTTAPYYDLPRYPFPLPDSPPRQVCQHGQYHSHHHSRYYAAQDPPGGSNDAPDPEAERRRIAAEEAGAKLHCIAELEKELNDAEMEHHDHAMQWGLPLRPGGKSKDPDRGRDPLPQPPNAFRPLWRRSDRYLVPRPPPDKGRPDLLPQPVGTVAANAPFMNARPIMIQVPKVFKGDHVDIERFFRDCMMYFEVHASYFILPSHMIPFATSLFDGLAKTWWVHKRMEYWSTPPPPTSDIPLGENSSTLSTPSSETPPSKKYTNKRCSTYEWATVPPPSTSRN
ncbi:hypothetical protein ARMSODRAFT_1023676 [Armillaria solidipes]|uniref:Uncharacterized protein n=1 Tax=Armillaria solidipes TaxID=1076256 RepID=A0A2H3AYP9_9AGAR|nr:hypothetical protein ARMSODRAFT_1023676 [Armillaria solidipes]